MINADDLRIDTNAHYGIEYYIYNDAGEIAASSIDTIAGSDLREEVKSRLFAYETLEQEGDRIELAGSRGALGGRRIVTYTKTD
ncbi:hypothetical protein [Streptomyces noursei]|uniref:hypothetical protein n=1 Tax=Streptomyces noursei TaxID=1971 RepID=UPI0016743487|nr:hypothetical protein [Streptomyces noursei]MCZ1019843.1 hypothetical protein [Streptomyces noursei]GGX36293.1 hypothetical protein GCM10010341_67170 [Streptomyces noursei]